MARVQWTGAQGITLVGDSFGPDDGQPVVLLHGGGQTRHAWGATGQALAHAGFHAVALDLRGHGDSGWAPDGDYLLTRFAEDLLTVLREHLGRPAAMVGASMGGLTTLVAQEMSPEWIQAVVLVDIAPRVNPTGVERILSFMRDRLGEGFTSLEDAADAIASFLPNRKRPRDMGGLSKNLRKGPDGRYHWHWDPAFVDRTIASDPNMAHDRLVELSRAISVPTLLVRGQLSDVLTREAADEFLALVPGAEYVDVKEAAHMIAGDKNDVFGAAVVDFLSRALSVP